jgi:hypothetical protein
METKTPIQHLDQRFFDMYQERSSWENHWRELIKNFSPRKGKFFTSDRNKGSPRNSLINNTPLFAKRVLRSGLMTGVTSPARPWFRLAAPDPSMEDFGAVRGWLNQAERLMYRVFASSNLYQQLPQLYDELATVGTGAMILEQDFENIIRFSSFTAGEYALDINGDLKVDTFAREYDMTVYQVVSTFGVENVSTATKTAWNKGSFSSVVTIRHIIEPVSIRSFDDSRFDLPPEFKFRSVYYEKGQSTDNKTILRVKGYYDFPIMTPRWDVRTGDVYGYSAAMDALGDALALQVQEREKGKAVAKMVSPPTKAPSSLKSANISLLPGGNTFVDDPSDVFSPIYQVQPRVQELSYDIQKTEDRINRAFYVDLFLMISQPTHDIGRTATEIASREEEKLLQLGPVLEALHNELLDPIIDRTFSILMKESERGWKGLAPMLLPPPPQELQDSNLKVDYISVLAQAQKLVSTSAIERWVGFTSQVAQFKPEVLDKVNGDEIVNQMAESLGVNSKVINDDEVVKQIRTAKAQQTQQQQQQQILTDMASAAKDLSATDTTSGNALSDLMGVAANG